MKYATIGIFVCLIVQTGRTQIDHLFYQPVTDSTETERWLSDHLERDRIEIIKFYFNDCGPCWNELKEWGDHTEEWMDTYGARVTCVNVRPREDDPHRSIHLMRSRGHPYPVLIGRKDFSRETGVTAVPSMAILYNGRVRNYHRGRTSTSEVYHMLEELSDDIPQSMSAPRPGLLNTMLDIHRPEGEYLYREYLSRDSIVIDGRVYHPLYHSDTDDTNARLQGYISQEQERVYYLSDLTAEPRLLMDFSLGMCASFNLPVLGSPFVLPVEVVDYYYRDGRKHLVFEPSIILDSERQTPFEFIQGIGTNAGWLYGLEEDRLSTYLVCQHDEGVNVYLNELFDGTCWPEYSSINADPEVASTKNTLHLYPNPANDHFILTSSVLNESSEVLVYQAHGQLVYRGAGTSRVDCKDWTSGLYHVFLVDKHGAISTRVMKE